MSCWSYRPKEPEHAPPCIFRLGSAHETLGSRSRPVRHAVFAAPGPVAGAPRSDEAENAGWQAESGCTDTENAGREARSERRVAERVVLQWTGPAPSCVGAW